MSGPGRQAGGSRPKGLATAARWPRLADRVDGTVPSTRSPWRARRGRGRHARTHDQAGRRAGRATQRADRPVVVGVDGSDLSLGALRWAAHEAALRGAPLRVVHAWGGMDQMYAEALVTAQGALVRQAEGILSQAVTLGLDGAADLPVDTVLSPDSAVRALIREAREAQLLVVGSRGLGGFARLLLGSRQPPARPVRGLRHRRRPH